MTSEMDRGHIYLAIDLKSFYASVECRERGLNPMTTNLVVADKSRTEKTICLAVSPSLKKYEIPGRPAVCGIHGSGSRYPDRSPCLQNRKKFGLYEKSHGRM